MKNTKNKNKKNNKKKKLTKKEKIIITIVVILLIILAVVGIIINIKSRTLKKVVEEFDVIYEDGVKINTSEELSKTKTIDNFELTNIRLSCTNGLSTLLGDLTNKGTTKTEETDLTVELLDKEGNVINELKATIKPLNPGETTQFNVNITTDVAGAYNFRISK